MIWHIDMNIWPGDHISYRKYHSVYEAVYLSHNFVRESCKTVLF